MSLEPKINYSSSLLLNAHELEYRVYSDLLQIEALTYEWDKLLAASSCNRAFASAEWYLASCHMNSTSMPYVTVGMHGATIECILPLVRGSDDIAKFPHFGNDYNDLIVRSDHSSLGSKMLSYAMLPHNKCERLLLERLRPDSNCLHSLSLLAHTSNLEHHCNKVNTFSFIDLPACFDEYLASKSKIFRKGIKRTLRKLELSGLVLRELSPEFFNPARLPELFIVLSLARQKEKSFLHNEDVRSFVRAVLPPIFKKRYLRAFALLQGEQILALDLCAVHARGLLTWNGGFVPEAESWSPGSALFAFGIRRAIEMGLREYDFAEGKEAYKDHWANNSYAVSELSILRN